MTPATPTLEVESALLESARWVIALDEVGRGALAGPVTLGCVAIDRSAIEAGMPEGLRDSKLVSEPRRAPLRDRTALWVSAWSLGWATAAEVDEHGIISALGLAAVRALEALGIPDAVSQPVLLDGNHDYISPASPQPWRVTTRVKGDRDLGSLAAASILAKVARDEVMVALDGEHPEFGWARNKGYASAEHRAAIARLGTTAHHRRSWALTDAPALF